MKYKMLNTASGIYVELESDYSDGWNFIKRHDRNTWYMAHLDNDVIIDNFVDFNTLSEEEFFQMQFVLDTNGFDLLLLRNIQKAVNEFIIQNNSGKMGMFHDLEVQ
ncbi:hypothetical protein AYH43_004034 [Escherichia coli]|nr:hypothetical protein [Escherichia coli]